MKMKIKHNSIMNINFDVFFVKIGDRIFILSMDVNKIIKSFNRKVSIE